MLGDSEFDPTSIIDLIPYHCIIKRLDNRISWANEAACNYIGMTRENIIGRYCYEVLLQQSYPCPDCPVSNFVQTGTSKSIEKTSLDGINWHIRCYFQKNKTGEITHVLVISEDITARKETEAKQEEYRKLLKSTLYAVDSLLLVIDRNYRIILSNWNDYEWLPEEVREKSTYCYQVLKNLNSPCGHCPPAKTFKDGKTRWYEDQDYIDKSYKEISVVPIFNQNGEVEYVLENVRDVTQRRRDEESLKKSEEKLSQIVDGSPVATFVINNKHIITHWNNACERLTELSKEKMSGSNDHWKAFYTEKRPVLADLVVDKYTDWKIQAYYPDKWRKSSLIEDGYEVEDFFSDLGENGKWLFFTAAPLVDHKGRLIGAIETLQDITERKRAEKNLQEAMSELIQIKNAQIKANRAYKILSQVNQTLIRAEHEQELMEKVCRIIVHTGEYNLAWVGYARNDNHKTVEKVAWAGEENYLKGIFVSWSKESEYGQCLGGRAIRLGEPVASRNIQADPSAQPWYDRLAQADFHSALALPLRNKGYTFGSLNIYSSDPDAFVQEEIYLFQELADDLSYGIHVLRVRQERRQAQKKLQESENRYRSLFHNANDAIYIHDLSGQILEVNQVACKMIGYSQEEFMQIKIMDLDAPEFAAMIPERIAELKQKGSIVFESAHQDKNGVIIPVEVSSRLIDYRGRQAIQSLARDITRRKRDEKEILIKNYALHSTINAVCLCDLNGYIFYVNPSFISKTGYSDPEEIYGQHVRGLDKDKNRADKILQIVKDQGEWRGEVICGRKDGSFFDTDLSANLVKDPQGKAVCILGIFEDISEIKQTRNDLQYTLTKLTKAFQGTIRTLSTALEMRDPYTAGHQERVTQLACAIAREMGLEDERIQIIFFAGMVHDIGKISIPAEILAKPADLSDKELDLIKEHPKNGYDILNEIELPWPIADIVHQHGSITHFLQTFLPAPWSHILQRRHQRFRSQWNSAA